MSKENVVEEIIERLKEAALETGKARRLRLRQLEMWTRWRHNCLVSLSQLVRWVDEIADARRALQVTVKSTRPSYLRQSSRIRREISGALISLYEQKARPE